ncbi:CAZyme family GH3 [Paecilomyces variotii]|nr:CAZyme family GH3 [Paecilomyces variotii]KAJ9370925.1 CAZyme family GH3 [Paecilomyces variotii]KAJ9397786.1 CAZyme family GH3 [Paecilomyces variotii]
MAGPSGNSMHRSTSRGSIDEEEQQGFLAHHDNNNIETYVRDNFHGTRDLDALSVSTLSSDSDNEGPAARFLLLGKSKKGNKGKRPQRTVSEKPGKWLTASCLTRKQCFWVVLVIFLLACSIAPLASAWKNTVEWWRRRPETDSPPWYPSPRGGTVKRWADSYSKAKGLVERMSLVEKVNVTTGTGWEMGLCVGNTGPAEGVRFPSLCLQDGPLGLRFSDHISAFPAGITTGATWNRDLMRKRGFALGQEARAKGVNVLLGPSMGPLGLMPAGGRNWEGFGSDPVLQAAGAAETIRGIQRNGVIATAKHFLLNEQEHFRQPYEWGISTALSSNIDDRSIREVFVWPFAESVRAGVASVMCSYQRVNNTHACENSKILNGLLKDELGFQGFVQSDWLAQRSGVDSALAGLDMSMPGDGLRWVDGDSLWGSQLTKAVLNGTVPMERLNDMVTRIVAAWYHLRQDSWDAPPPFGKGGPNFSSWTNDEVGLLHPGSDDETTGVVNKFVDAQGKGAEAHSIIARQVATEGIVLLKNEDNILPLSRGSPEPGRTYRVGVYGEDAGPGNGPNACPDRGCNQGTLASGWGSGAVEFPYLVAPSTALQAAWNSSDVETTAYLNNDVDESQLTDKDLCMVFVNADGGEGFINSDGIHGDRNDLFLQKGGDELVQKVANGCGAGKGKTIVVVHAVGPVIMESWIENPGVKAVLLAHLPGQESGNALVDVLFGVQDASGRLPYTIGKSLEDYGPGAQVLYEPNGEVPQVNLSNALYIDYRYFDRHDISPRYEFGFGLSYTTIELSDLRITPLQKKYYLPSPRPRDTADPPDYDNTIPAPETALFPEGFRKLKKYIYPYISSIEEAEPNGHYEYPAGYEKAQEPSPAGGDEGGNPSLYDLYAQVNVRIQNTGSRIGREVVQVYVSFPPVSEWDEDGEHPIDFPVRVLRNFVKVQLKPGQSRNIELTLTRKDLSYWSTRYQNWIMPTNGTFKIGVGRSSRNLPLVGEY